ncbi:MAG: hypothetical protein Tsb0034_08820 [Ekhidna sp.]
MYGESQNAIGQCTNVDFTINSTVCIGEQILIDNIVGSAPKYEWDYCANSIIEGIPSADEIDYLKGGNGYDFDIISSDENYYLFVPDRTNGELLRLDFSDGLLLNPGTTSLGDFGGSLSDPTSISIVENGSDYIGLLVSYTSNKIQLLDFGTSITSPPIVSDLTPFVTLNGPAKVELFEQSGNYYAFILELNIDQIKLISFGATIDETFTTSDIAIANSNLITDFDLLRTCDEVLMAVSSRNNNTVNLLNFSSGVESAPVQSIISTTIPRPVGIDIVELENFQILVASFDGNGDVFRITLDNSLVLSNQENLGNLNGTTRNVGMELVYDQGDWHVLHLKENGSLFRYSFPKICNLETNYSASLQPENFAYNSADEIKVLFRSITNEGEVATTVKSITVQDEIAPISEFGSDNICVSSQVTFTPSDPNLSTYSWDFNGDGVEDVFDNTGSDQVYDFSVVAGGPGPGTYLVRLDVNDGTCDNFYEEEITIYTDPPAPSFNVSNANECTNTAILFTNTTDESQHPGGVLTYHWDFNNDGIVDSSDPNPTFSYDTPGDKTISVTSSIPGCESSATTMDVTIQAGPTADFFAASVCDGEAMQFTNTSTDAVTYSWDFGDGFVSTAESPDHIFDAPGSYFVQLTASDGQCEATEVIEVVVSDVPEVNFDFDVPCTSESGISFMDLSTLENADITSWSWQVDGVEVSTGQHPTITFDSPGIKTISLSLTGSNGCDATYQEDVEVLSAPEPDFLATVGCQGESTTFEDLSTGGSIVSWLWDVDGTTYATQDISHVFTNPGSYEVMLEVTNQNFCSESITKTIEVLQLPDLDFSLSGDCSNESIQVNDISTEYVDEIVSRSWRVDGTIVGNGAQVVLETLDQGTYELMLEVQTANGCITNLARSIVIDQAPEAAMRFDRYFGAPPAALTFTNTSSGATSYSWLLDGNEVSTDASSQEFTFTEAGNYQVALAAQNNLGCSDTTFQQVVIAIPEVDLRIEDMQLVQEGETRRIFLNISNQSNLPIDRLEAKIELENQFSVTEPVVQFLEVGEAALVGLSVGIPMITSQADYLCVTLLSPFEGYENLAVIEGERCLTLEQTTILEDPFPNPVQDRFRLKLVVPEEGEVVVDLINSSGKLEASKTFQTVVGLNNFFVEMSTLDTGVYFVIVRLDGNSFQRRVLKL